MSDAILQVRDLRTEFRTEGGIVRAVDGVSFEVERGQTLGIVGESGSGKSVTNLSILRLIPDPPGRITGGSIRFAGQDLLSLPEAGMRRIRGKRISMIFQDPMTSLNPYLRVGTQLGEVLELHEHSTRAEARRRSIEMLERVGIPDAPGRIDRYPHEFSGGMRQRVMIAMALFRNPHHPYTLGLLRSIPRLDGDARRLVPIPGRPPDLTRLGAGCPFVPRCEFATAQCRAGRPDLRVVCEVAGEHTAACWHEPAAAISS
jgi:oligopeptide/dipeptide ABC transporter ATP-binding protein